MIYLGCRIWLRNGRFLFYVEGIDMTKIISAMALAILSMGAISEADQGQALLAMVKDRDRAIQAIVRSETKGETPEERDRLKTIVGEVFDFVAFSELSLGRDWAERTEDERREFTDLNQRLIERNYADPKLYTRADKIDYTGVAVNGSEATVNTVVYYKTEKSAIDYKLHLVDGKWLIYDMVIDDLSIGQSNRSQFRREIRRSSFAGLMDKLRERLAQEGTGEKGGT